MNDEKNVNVKKKCRVGDNDLWRSPCQASEFQPKQCRLQKMLVLALVAILIYLFYSKKQLKFWCHFTWNSQSAKHLQKKYPNIYRQI